MNRILKRPMFRIGGSAGTGITTGLDTPRQNYNIAGRVLPTQEEFETAKEMFPQFQQSIAPNPTPLQTALGVGTTLAGIYGLTNPTRNLFG